MSENRPAVKPATDTEVICAWMEPPPSLPTAEKASPLGWWVWGRYAWVPSSQADSLDALHEAEERLTDEQWQTYRNLIQESVDPRDDRWSRILLHASAAQKSKALASVIRGGQ